MVVSNSLHASLVITRPSCRRPEDFFSTFAARSAKVATNFWAVLPAVLSAVPAKRMMSLRVFLPVRGASNRAAPAPHHAAGG